MKIIGTKDKDIVYSIINDRLKNKEGNLVQWIKLTKRKYPQLRNIDHIPLKYYVDFNEKTFVVNYMPNNFTKIHEIISVNEIL